MVGCPKGRRASKKPALHLTPQTAVIKRKKMLPHVKVLNPVHAPMQHPKNPPSLIPWVSKDQAGPRWFPHVYWKSDT